MRSCGVIVVATLVVAISHDAIQIAPVLDKQIQNNEETMEENAASLIAEALQRLGSPEALNAWLLTPVSPGGKKPIDYLKERQYTIFRGFLLHTPTGREKFHPVPPSDRVHRERPRREVEQVRRLLKPRAWIDENDDVDTSGTN